MSQKRRAPVQCSASVSARMAFGSDNLQDNASTTGGVGRDAALAALRFRQSENFAKQPRADLRLRWELKRPAMRGGVNDRRPTFLACGGGRRVFAFDRLSHRAPARRRLSSLLTFDLL